jgi:hypothetical protein
MKRPCEPPTLLVRAYEVVERSRRLLRCMSHTWLELDGNRQTVPSRQPEHFLQGNHCPHHGGKDGLGDPLFS